MDRKPELLHVNTLWVYLAIGLIAGGYLCMYIDSEKYGFGSLGLTVGAVLCTAGFVMPIIAIMQAKRETEAPKA